MSSAVAGLTAAGSVVSLMASGKTYGRQITALADAAMAQDVVNLVVVVPLFVAIGAGAAHGSLSARLCWPGCLAFMAYNYAIFAFSLHFASLFLLWTAVLGLSAFTLGGVLSTPDALSIRDRFGGRVMAFTGGLLVTVAALRPAVAQRDHPGPAGRTPLR